MKRAAASSWPAGTAKQGPRAEAGSGSPVRIASPCERRAPQADQGRHPYPRVAAAPAGGRRNVAGQVGVVRLPLAIARPRGVKQRVEPALLAISSPHYRRLTPPDTVMTKATCLIHDPSGRYSSIALRAAGVVVQTSISRSASKLWRTSAGLRPSRRCSMRRTSVSRRSRRALSATTLVSTARVSGAIRTPRSATFRVGECWFARTGSQDV